MSNGSPAGDGAKTGRIAQILQTYKLTKKSDPRIGWILLAVFLPLPIIISVGAWLLSGRTFTWSLIPWIIIGILLGLILATIVFGRRAERPRSHGRLDDNGAERQCGNHTVTDQEPQPPGSSI